MFKKSLVGLLGAALIISLLTAPALAGDGGPVFLSMTTTRQK